ncbi:hypothetical protein SB784_34840, partial [Burkholderia sp. SIMBA_048]
AGSLYVVEAETLEQLFRVYWWNHRFYDENKKEVDEVRSCIQSAIVEEDSEFARLSGGPAGSREWARVNIQANWILSAAVSRSGAMWCSGPGG